MSEPADGVLTFAPKPAMAETDGAPIPSERDVIMQTLENVLEVKERLEAGMKLATRVIQDLQRHVRDLEHDVAELKKPKRAIILNSQGSRAS